MNTDAYFLESSMLDQDHTTWSEESINLSSSEAPKPMRMDNEHYSSRQEQSCWILTADEMTEMQARVLISLMKKTDESRRVLERKKIIISSCENHEVQTPMITPGGGSSGTTTSTRPNNSSSRELIRTIDQNRSKRRRTTKQCDRLDHLHNYCLADTSFDADGDDLMLHPLPWCCSQMLEDDTSKGKDDSQHHDVLKYYYHPYQHHHADHDKGTCLDDIADSTGPRRNSHFQEHHHQNKIANKEINVNGGRKGFLCEENIKYYDSPCSHHQNQQKNHYHYSTSSTTTRVSFCPPPCPPTSRPTSRTTTPPPDTAGCIPSTKISDSPMLIHSSLYSYCAGGGQGIELNFSSSNKRMLLEMLSDI